MNYLMDFAELFTSKNPIRREDAAEFVKYGILGFVALGGIKASQSYARRNVLPSSALKYQSECFHLDSSILEQFLVLQRYHKLNDWALRMAVTNCDCILYLKNALSTGAVVACNSDKILVFTYFRVACKRLDTFGGTVRSKMSPKHALVVSTAINALKERMKTHVVDVLRICADFNPRRLLERVDADVNAALVTQ